MKLATNELETQLINDGDKMKRLIWVGLLSLLALGGCGSGGSTASSTSSTEAPTTTTTIPPLTQAQLEAALPSPLELPIGWTSSGEAVITQFDGKDGSNP